MLCGALFLGYPRFMPNQTRPSISTITTGAELRRWYWLKSELTEAARQSGLKVSGAKFTILDRIAHFLDTGERDLPRAPRPKRSKSFDWHSAPLSNDTLITQDYRNTQNVRRYFISEVGNGFKFNIAFMEWINSNTGKSLGDAVNVFIAQKLAAKDTPSVIKPHNQFNQYTRDFMADNPASSLNEVRRVWELKRALPSEDGRHRYDLSDLDL